MKECLRCKVEFEPTKPKQKFCSDKCRAYYHREQVALIKSDRSVLGVSVFKKLPEGEIERVDPTNLSFVDMVNESGLFVTKPEDAKSVTIPLKPVKLKNESGIDYSIRLAEWKEKQLK